jgi:hypothetical protein
VRLLPRRAEEGFAVVAAEEEGEAVQVLAQLADVVGGVADECFQRRAEAARSRASQPVRRTLRFRFPPRQSPSPGNLNSIT